MFPFIAQIQFFWLLLVRFNCLYNALGLASRMKTSWNVISMSANCKPQFRICRCKNGLFFKKKCVDFVLHVVSISRRMYVGITILDRTRVQACSCTGIIERVEIPFPSNKIIYLNSPRAKPIKITILYRKKNWWMRYMLMLQESKKCFASRGIWKEGEKFFSDKYGLAISFYHNYIKVIEILWKWNWWVMRLCVCLTIQMEESRHTVWLQWYMMVSYTLVHVWR